MKKIIKFIPGFDYIIQGPPEKKKYGRHGMSIRFILKGKEGAVVFLMYTGWLPRIKDGLMWKPTFYSPTPMSIYPMAVDIGYHSPKPLYDFQKKDKPNQKECSFLDNKPCYYDGSAIHAGEFMAELFNKGEKAFWKMMKDYYKETFSQKKGKK